MNKQSHHYSLYKKMSSIHDCSFTVYCLPIAKHYIHFHWFE